jgi:arsenite methyltransferase
MSDSIITAVKEKYSAAANSSLSSENPGVHAVAEAFGYSPEELASIPANANLGLSCGNPTATAHLKPGEVVVDLGSGGGLDVFLAAQKVGPAGKAIGIDMTPAMIDRASKNAQEANLANVQFLRAPIDKIPLASASVDCVISNCVINLAPDKPAVFKEIARILKPGGRLAVSDIALKKTLPPELASDVMAYVGCIAGALFIPDYEAQLKAAGFQHIQIIDSNADLNAYANVENQSACCSPVALTQEKSPCCTPAPAAQSPCCTPAAPQPCCTPSQKIEDPLHTRLAQLLRQHNINDYAASVKIFALKPSV